ncbi:hypothetical protein D3C74_428340 [compost metagenome]
MCTGSDAIWERFGADRAYLDDLEAAAADDTDDAGASDDLRVTGEWVVGEHRRQLAHLRRARSA